MPTPRIETVLFDADGVVQRPTIDWRDTLTSFVAPAGDLHATDPATMEPTEPVGERGSADDFIRDLMASEHPALVGKGDFGEAVTEVLQRWGLAASPEEVLAVWAGFEADDAVVEIIQNLRAAGVRCHLATNQHAYRRRIMQDERHYGDWFDQTFYSSDLGVAKPDPAYFRAILATIDQPAESVLFIDDNQVNVTAARTVGLHAEQYDLKSGLAALRELLRRYDLPGSADTSS